jgi:hypothetical protein
VYKHVPIFRRRSTIIFGGLAGLAIFFAKDVLMDKVKDTASAIQSAKEGYQNERRFQDLLYETAKTYFTLEVVQRRIEEGRPDVGGHKYNLDLGVTGNMGGRGKALLEALAPAIDLLPDQINRRERLSVLEDQINQLRSQLGRPRPGSTLEDDQRTLSELSETIQDKDGEIEAFALETLAKADELKKREELYHAVFLISAIVFFVAGVTITVGSALTDSKAARIKV